MELVAHAAGRLAGATSMASLETRSAALLRQLCAVWETYLRDAGAGDVGREHRPKSFGLFKTMDPRRDGILLWLADHAGPALADSAAAAVRAIRAKQRLEAEALDALAIALELMPAAPDKLSATETFDWLWAYVERLKREPDFAETSGELVEIAVSTMRVSTYRSATPGACWAANLALAARTPTALLTIPPGTLSRLLFRLDTDRDEQRDALASDWLRGLERSDMALWKADRDLRRGSDHLVRRSKHARGRQAWALIVASGGVSRVQLTRALGLTRGGASIVIRQLTEAGLVRLSVDNHIDQADETKPIPAPLDSRLASAAEVVDEALADIDRVLARIASKGS